MSGSLVKITLGGAPFQMKPSYGAMREIENRTDFTVTELLELVVAERIKIQEAVLIVWYGCEAAGESFDGIEALGDVVFEQRISSLPLRKSMSEFLLNCLFSPAEAKKKFDEEVAPLLSPPPTG